MGRTLLRQISDIAQKGLGRQPLRYTFDLYPLSIGNIPDGVEYVSLVWERGTKISYTDPEKVDTATKSVRFNQYLTQSTTVVKNNNKFLPKDFTFKVQKVQGVEKKQEKRTTIAKLKVDLSQYCTCSTTPETHKLALEMKPLGFAHLTLKTTWLQYVTPDNDMESETQSQSIGDYNDTLSEVDSDLNDSTRRISSLKMKYSSQSSMSTLQPTISEVEPVCAQDIDGDVRLRKLASIKTQGTEDLEGSRPRLNSRTRSQSLDDLDEQLKQTPPIRSQEPDQATSDIMQQSLAMLTPDDDADARVSPAGSQGDPDGPKGSVMGWMWRWNKGDKEPQTDEILKQIDSETDAKKMAVIARSMLAQRNEWRLKCTQAEGSIRELQHELNNMRTQKSNMMERLTVAEERLGQLQEQALLRELVDAKVALAQSSMEAYELQGELNQERSRLRQVAMRLTAVESERDTLVNRLVSATLGGSDSPRTPPPPLSGAPSGPLAPKALVVVHADEKGGSGSRLSLGAAAAAVSWARKGRKNAASTGK